MDYKIEFLPIGELKPYEKNAKKHPKEQIDKIAKSIQEFGFRQNLVIDQNNAVVIGHGRLLAARQLGIESVPCIRVDDLSPEQIKALRLADNRVAESDWDEDLLRIELDDIINIDMLDFGFDLGGNKEEEAKHYGDLGLESEKDRNPENEGGDENEDEDEDNVGVGAENDGVRASLKHNVFENQDRMQFPCNNFYGIPEMRATQTCGNKLLRFCDHGGMDDLSEYIAHFYYDDFKFIQAWRDPDKYIDKLCEFKAVVAPDFSLYTDFPRALQILSCYRRQWCGAYWQSLGIDVIPDVVWGDEESFAYCFDGIPKHSVVAVSSVGVSQDKEWNGAEGERFLAGYNEMLKRLEPTKIIFYGSALDGLEGDIIRVPSFYEQRREMLNERSKIKYGTR